MLCSDISTRLQGVIPLDGRGYIWLTLLTSAPGPSHPSRAPNISVPMERCTCNSVTIHHPTEATELSQQRRDVDQCNEDGVPRVRRADLPQFCGAAEL
jgi:hypothetical protein